MKSKYNVKVGDRFQNNAGEWFTVKQYNNVEDVLVEFDKNGHQKRTTIYSVVRGAIRLPNFCVGDVLVDRDGLPAKIVKVQGINAITLEWEDGVQRVHRSSNLGSGQFMHPLKSKYDNPEIKVGQKWETNQGCIVEVVGYETSKRITVQFCDPHKFTVVTTQANLKSGAIRNRYLPTFCGVGVIGDAVFDPRGRMYRKWSQMLMRVYYEPARAKYKTYADCSVCSEWHVLGQFNDWYIRQIIEPGWQIDKDLLVKGNKVYGPTYCVFLPRELNSFLTKRQNCRGEQPIGVSRVQETGRYLAQMTKGGRSLHIGSYNTPEEAFQAYKKCKEGYARELAAKWRDKIDLRAYNALMNYTVEITD
jgi:hypothetical protein